MNGFSSIAHYFSIQNWNDLKPNDEELKNGLLTQLGGCLVLNSLGDVKFEWRDAGICHVANFEDILDLYEQ